MPARTIDWEAIHRRLAASAAAISGGLHHGPEEARRILEARARAAAKPPVEADNCGPARGPGVLPVQRKLCCRDLPRPRGLPAQEPHCRAVHPAVRRRGDEPAWPGPRDHRPALVLRAAGQGPLRPRSRDRSRARGRRARPARGHHRRCALRERVGLAGWPAHANGHPEKVPQGRHAPDAGRARRRADCSATPVSRSTSREPRSLLTAVRRRQTWSGSQISGRGRSSCSGSACSSCCSVPSSPSRTRR